MTDKQLYRLCKKFGRQALQARRKFIGLLPEVFKRNLFQKKGFSSIYEFAAKLAGISHEQVNTVLRLEKRFTNLPELHQALTTGKISVNKLVRIASIATVSNQAEVVQLATLPRVALEIVVRDLRKDQFNIFSTEQSTVTNDLIKAENHTKTLHVQTLHLAEDVQKQLQELQNKGIDLNDFLRNCLKHRTAEIAQEKAQLADEEIQKTITRQGQIKLESITTESKKTAKTSSTTPSRHIPIKIQRLLKKEHGSKCSIPSCGKASTTLHHTQRFALSQNHDPRFIAPLCKGHHQLAHFADLNYQRKLQFSG